MGLDRRTVQQCSARAAGLEYRHYQPQHPLRRNLRAWAQETMPSTLHRYRRCYSIALTPDPAEAEQPETRKAMNVTNDIVTRFLNWPLPQSVLPDSCVMDRNYPNRIGTNLLTATEARQMLEHVLQLPEPAKAAGEARQYAQRDSEALGEDYMRHVDAMTREGIHSKAAIAGELAHRDAEIARLRQVVERLSTERDRLEAGWRQAERERDSLATENDGLRVEAKLAMEATGCDDPVKALSTIRRWHEEDSALRQEKEAAERRVAELEASAAGMRKVLEAHRRYHGKVSCPGLPECYVCDIEEKFDAALSAARPATAKEGE